MLEKVRQLKQLREENTRLKQVVADLTLDKAMLQDVLAKILGPSRRRQVVKYLHDAYRVSEWRAWGVARMRRATFRYRSHGDPRTEPRIPIREIAQTRVRYGKSGCC